MEVGAAQKEEEKEEACLGRGIDHLLKCSQQSSQGNASSGLTRGDAVLLLKKMGCVSYLNGGTFGAVFTVQSPERHVVKFITLRGSKSVLPCSAEHEYKMQKKFSRKCLGWKPHSLKLFQLSSASEGGGAAKATVHAILMPFVDMTLDVLIRKEVEECKLSTVSFLGERLAELVKGALEAGLVHNDSKCNNIGLSRTGKVGFIDFGRSFDRATLKHIGLSKKRVDYVLILGTALDAWRLQDSIGRWIEKSIRGGAEELAIVEEALLAPLRKMTESLLRPLSIFSEETWENTAWCTDAEVKETIKLKFAGKLKKRRSAEA